MKRNFRKHFELIFFISLFLFSLLGTSAVYLLRLNGPPIRSDGMGYYVYLPSVFIYNDISLNKFVDAFTTFYGDEKTDTWNGATIYEDSGKYLNKYPVGVAVMSLPFFLIGHAGTLILSNFSGVPLDGFSDDLYHITQSVSGTFYAILGLFILKRFLDKYFSKYTVYITILLITFGTNLFHYFTYDASFSHAYSFFLFALFIFLTQKWHLKPSIRNSIYMGLTTGLIAIVRPTNLLIILFFLLYGVGLKKLHLQLLEKIKLYLKSYSRILLIALSSLLIVSLQIYYWYSITGKLFVYSYGNEYFDFTNPQILNVLFSIQKGLFFWSPILLLSLVGLLLLNRYIKGMVLGIAVFMLVNIYVVSSWWAWSYGGSYGMRALVDSFPFFAILMAPVIQKVVIAKSKILKTSFLIFVLIALFLSIFMMIQYWRGYIPIDGTNIDVYLNALRNIPRV